MRGTRPTLPKDLASLISDAAPAHAEPPAPASAGEAAGAGDVPDEHRYLEALIADYESLRSDFERLDQSGLALLAITVTITAGIGAFLAHTCSVHALRCTPQMWPSLYAFVPAIPFAIILLFADLGNAKTLRMFYTRAVEAELRRVAQSPQATFADGNAIRLPAYGHIAVGIFGQHRGRIRYRFTVFFVYALVGLLFASTTAVCLWISRPIDLQVIMGMLYVALIVVVLRIAYFGGSGARRLWREATLPSSWLVAPAEPVPGPSEVQGPSVVPGPSVVREPPVIPEPPVISEPRDARARPRSITAYLMTPRPHELLVRFWLVPAAWLYASFATGQFSAVSLLWVLAATFIFEWLFYQARYVINDLRSMDSDAQYSAYKKRNRFPTPAQPSWVRYAVLAVLARIGVGVWATLRLLPGRFAPVLLIAAAALAVQSAVYEMLRASVSHRPARGLCYISAGRVSIYLVVGLGYVIRAWTGFALGGIGLHDRPEAVLLSAAVLAFGTMSVTMAWALSSISQVVPSATGTWPVGVYRTSLLRYTHLGPLCRQARLLARSESLQVANDDAIAMQATDRSLRSWRLLEAVSSLAWWNGAAVVFYGAASAAAVSAYGHGSAGLTMLALLIGLAVGIAVVAGYGLLLAGHGPLRFGRAPAWRLLACLLVGFAAEFVGCAWAGNVRAGLSAACALTFANLNYLYFRRATPDSVEVTLTEVLHTMSQLARRVVGAVGRYVIGDYAARLLLERKQPD